ncbi:TIGR00730 family Rossman fold protein [Jatrophihabitans sp. YIM 134969]
MRVCVYCGSSSTGSSGLRDTASLVGTRLADCGIGLVYGGARVGLMGAVADAALAAGGEVDGVIPTSMMTREIAHRGLTRLHVVDTMAQRKDLMAELSDAFVVLPGGIGTLDEFFETWTLHHLGERVKPIALLDVDGFFAPLLRMIEHTVEAGFLARSTADSLIVETDVDALLDRLMPATGTTDDALDVVAWVLVRDGALLVARTRGSDAFYAPGGKVEPGETQVAALVREMREELGVEVDPLTVTPLTTVTAPAHGGHAGRTVRLACFTASTLADSPEPRPAGEIEELRWVHDGDGTVLAPANRVLFDQLRSRGLVW